MTTSNDYLAYPANRPKNDGYYLVLVKPELILRLGLAPSPPILIAKYSLTTREWTTVLGVGGIGNIGNEVIS